MPLSELSRHVGEEMGVSSWTTLDQERINEFAHCTGDHQWIHVDVERAARESPFGGTIAHGYLTRVTDRAHRVRAAGVARRARSRWSTTGWKRCASTRRCARASACATASSSPAVEERGSGRYRVTTENTIEIEGEIKPALIASAIAIFIG